MKSLDRMHGQLSRAGMQWALLVLTLAIMGAVFVTNFLADFRHHRSKALENLSIQARLIDANVERQLDTVHFALGSLRAALADTGKVRNLTDMRHRLDGIRDSLPGVRTLAILDAEGTILVSNREEIIGGNFAHRDYFRQVLAKPDPDRLYVSRPFRTVLGVLTINATRAVVAPDGRFAGVVTATLDPEFFVKLMRSVVASEDMYALLVVGERTTFLGLPDKALPWLQAITERQGELERMAERIEAGDAELPMVSSGGETRAVAVRGSRTKSMTADSAIKVVVSRSLAELEADGYYGMAFRAGLYGTVALLSMAALLLYQRRQSKVAAAHARQSQALRDKERFLSRLAENLPGLISHWDSDLRCTFANHAYGEWFGRRPDEMIGMRLQDLLGEKGFALSEPHIRGALSGEPQQFERMLVKPDGSTGYVWAQFIPDRDDDAVRGYFSLVSDITAVKSAQLALEQANAALAARTLQAEEASAAKTRFLSGVSHELRTPLHTILGYVKLLLRQTEGDVRRQLAVVERSGTQLLKLIDDLLEFNRGVDRATDLQPEAVCLADLAGQLEHIGRLMAEQCGNRFAVAMAEGLPVAVTVDEQRLLQVLQNLIGNACKYTRNGSVVLSIDLDDEGQSADTGRCGLCFSVADDGIGIAEEDQEKIFDAFNRGTVAGEHPGLGLGLTIARQWVRAMGGELRVSSSVGKGSRFYFTLDLPTATAGQYPTATACEAYRDGLAASPCTVLVVDDVAENRLLLADILARHGFAAVEAGSGEEALTVCAQTPIDAVLVDQFMPGIDGWEFLRRLRRTPAGEHLPAMLVSASEPQRPAALPADIDFDRFMTKPLDEQALVCWLCLCLKLAQRKPADCPHRSAPDVADARVALPAADAARFRQLLDLGLVSGIESWADELAARDLAYAEFSRQVVEHCRAANLAGLEKLLAAAVRP